MHARGWILIGCLVSAATGCAKDAQRAPEPGRGETPDAGFLPPGTNIAKRPPPSEPSYCAMDPSGWCPSLPGDPCGAHRDEGACRADDRCEGVPYRGESMVPCIAQDRCFASNCPAVGCVSRCEPLGEPACGLHVGRCAWRGERCVTERPCGGAP